MRHIPNIISLMRVLFWVPLALFLVGVGHPLAGAICGTIGLSSDFADGRLARKFGWVSNFGKGIDPLADAICFVAIYVYIMKTGHFGAVQPIVFGVFIFFMFRIAINTLGVIYMSAKGMSRTLAVNNKGKWAAGLQMAFIGVYFWGPVISSSASFTDPLDIFGNLFHSLVGVSCMLAVLSLWEYIENGFSLLVQRTADR